MFYVILHDRPHPDAIYRETKMSLHEWNLHSTMEPTTPLIVLPTSGIQRATELYCRIEPTVEQLKMLFLYHRAISK
jgi:hypothetical protein